MCTREPFVDSQVLTVTLGNQSQPPIAVSYPKRKSLYALRGPINEELISYSFLSSVTKLRDYS